MGLVGFAGINADLMNNALLNIKFVRVVVCSHCKAQCEWDKEPVTCWACSTEIVFDGDTLVGRVSGWLNGFWR